MEKKKTEEHCNHNFEYSHRETDKYEVDGYFETRLVDVTVCTKCGKVKRS